MSIALSLTTANAAVQFTESYGGDDIVERILEVIRKMARKLT